MSAHAAGHSAQNGQSSIAFQWQLSRKANEAVGFLDLPRELRDVIYHYALKANGVVVLGRPRQRTYLMRHWDGETAKDTLARLFLAYGTISSVSIAENISIALLRTCRQIHAEACPLVYHHMFHLGTGYIMNNNILSNAQSWNDFQQSSYSALGSINLSSTYTPLVRRLSFRYMHDEAAMPSTIWRVVLREGNDLVQMFESLEDLTIRIDTVSGWHQWEDLLTSKFKVADDDDATHVAESKEDHLNRILMWLHANHQVHRIVVPECLHVDTRIGILQGAAVFSEAVERFKTVVRG